MNARRLCVWFVALGLSVAPVQAQESFVPLAVREGLCECVLPARSPACVLIVGSLTPAARPAAISIRSEFTALPARLPRETIPDVRREFLEARLQIERLKRYRQPFESYPPLADPPQQKSFALFMAEHDLENPAGYVQVKAELRGVGKYVQIYLDSQDPMNPDLDQMIAEVTRTFDQEVYPWSRTKLGQVADVDRDGRFTILLSGRLQRLQAGKVTLDGFVRGSDFLRDVGPPFGNRCDMMYLNAHLRAGPHLRTVLAHEYTHAVTFSEHVLNNAPNYRHDEESWLSEGLAHLVEDLHQHGWSNLDYRVSAYLAQPEQYPLIVADYFGSGLWRTPGTRGSVYLFLRWCQSKYGPDLPRRLIQSPVVGMRNLEDATGKPFAELFRGWGVSLVNEDSWRIDRPLLDRLQRPQDPDPGRLLCGPHITMLTAKDDFPLAGTGIRFILVPAAERNRLMRIQGEKDSRLQATLVPLDPHRGLLTLDCRRHAEAGALVVDVTAHGSAVRLDSASWERLVPSPAGPDETSSRSLNAKSQTLLVPAGETRTYTLVGFLPTRTAQELVIKVHGKDAEDRPVAALTYLPAAE